MTIREPGANPKAAAQQLIGLTQHAKDEGLLS